MASPTTLIYHEMDWTIDGVSCPIWKTPNGYVVPFADFQKYTQAFAAKYARSTDLLIDSAQEMQLSTSLFEETTQYIEDRYKKSIQEWQNQTMIYKIAFIVASIVAIILGLALIGVLAL